KSLFINCCGIPKTAVRPRRVQQNAVRLVATLRVNRDPAGIELELQQDGTVVLRVPSNMLFAVSSWPGAVELREWNEAQELLKKGHGGVGNME
ncbi:hypothetical protein Tco_1358392, partial [Tanacetum coccineum]